MSTGLDRSDSTGVGGLALPSALPETMLNDLREIARLDDAAVQRVAELMASSRGILSAERIIEIATEHVGDDAAEAIARVALNIAPGDVDRVACLLDAFRQMSPQSLPEPAVNQIRQHLNLLLRDYPALKLMRKADRLLRETGNELQSIIFVCDLRPVYDDEHSEVAAFIPLVNMQIGYSEQNGNAEFVEMVLTADELQHIIARGNDALKKLQVLDATLRQTPEVDTIP